ncbi:MAG: cytochrome P450 [Acidimicrobiia bacterium]
MTEYDQVDFFRDDTFVADPFPYFAALRGECPVRREPHHGIVMVTGYEEAVSIYNDTENWSSCVSVTGPFPGFPVPIDEGATDITDLIIAHRDELPMSDQLPTLDPPTHTDHRAILMRMITPKRLSENEEFMWRLADRQLDEFVANGKCEFIADFAGPFALLVIADLLGVPEEDHPRFRAMLHDRKHDSAIGGLEGSLQLNPLEFLYQEFTNFIEDRRANPRDDVLTGLAQAKFPDGSEPPVRDVVTVAANLFAAGQETTVRLLGAAMQFIAERADLQQWLRDDPSRLRNFVEETLRMESPVKGDFRISRRPTTVGGVDLPAGTTVMLVNAAANRDPSLFPDPDTFDAERANARQHVAFGRGIHTCPGAPLARAEGVISLTRILERMADIRIDEAVHGPADNRRYSYVPTYILRGLTRLHIEFTPVDAPARATGEA